jgi:opacity protein-like surface antigen
MRIRRLLCAGLLGTAICPSAASSQATGDEARLLLGVTLGVATGANLWSVGSQPVQFIVPADTFAVTRRIRSNLVVGFGGTYFSNQNLGIAIEGFLIGLGLEDNCRQVFSSGSGDIASVCRSLQGREKPASAVTLSVGPVLRFNSRKPLSPYARANVGFTLSNQSALRTSGEFPTDSGPSTVVVYSDDRNSRLDPSIALGVGVTAALSKGSLLRWEIRDNMVGIQKVTGGIPVAGFVPPHKRVFKHLFSMSVGFDIILERRRGRRY